MFAQDQRSQVETWREGGLIQTKENVWVRDQEAVTPPRVFSLIFDALQIHR